MSNLLKISNSINFVQQMACLWIINKLGARFGPTVFPMAKFVPAVTMEQKIIGGGGKFLWEAHWLSWDAKILTISYLIFMPCVLLRIMEYKEPGSTNGMGLGVAMISLGSAPGVYSSCLFLVGSVAVFRTARTAWMNRLKVLQFTNK